MLRRSCPRCKRRFKNEATVLNHQNQPRSRCRLRYEQLLEISLSKKKYQLRQATNRLARSNVLQPSSSGTHSQLQPDSSSEPDNFESNPQTYHSGIHGSENDIEMLPDDAISDDNPRPDIQTSNHYHIDEYSGSAMVFGSGRNFMDKFDADQFSSERMEQPYYPFASRDEWELASYLLRSSLSMAAIDQLLKLELVK